MSSRTKSNPFTALQGVSLSKSLLELHKKRSLTERDLVKDGPKSRPSSSRKSSSVTLTEQTEQIHSSQVIIHVYDEARGLQRDFYCEKSLLASQMKYFSSLIQEKTVDIDVHSDLKVFERLMGYCIHKEIHLNVGNVVSILISCHFLQMEQLELQCLEFMVFNMEKVLEAPIDFGCIHRTLVEKLARLYEPYELYRLQDPKDKIKTMLCLHKIQDLVSGLKQCVHCQDLYVDDRAVCFAAIPELDHHGNIQRIHESSPTFDINDWIIRDYLECKSWQDVFMKIWGYSSTFTCVACNRIFDLMHLRTCSTNDGYSQSDEFLEFCPFETDLSQQDHHAQQLDPSLFDSFSRFKDTVPKIKYSLEVPKVKSNPKISKSKLNGYQTKPYIQRDLDQDQIRQWIQELRL